MKKLALTVAVATFAVLGWTAAAPATIVSHDPGDPVTTNGTITIAGNFATTQCNISLNGRLLSYTSVSITSGSGACNTGTLALDGFNWTKTINLDGTWSMRWRHRETYPIIGSCIYYGTIGGTWQSDGSNTYLTIVRSSTSLTRDAGSSSLCSATPSISGALTLLGVVTD